jgi:hypothetical protein
MLSDSTQQEFVINVRGVTIFDGFVSAMVDGRLRLGAVSGFRFRSILERGAAGNAMKEWAKSGGPLQVRRCAVKIVTSYLRLGGQERLPSRMAWSTTSGATAYFSTDGASAQQF